MKILVVGHHNPNSVSARAFRIRELVLELSARGHNIDLIVASEQRLLYDVNSKNIDEKNSIHTLQSTNDSKRNSHLMFLSLKKCLVKIYRYFFSAPQYVKPFIFLKRILKTCSSYDVVIAVSLPFYTLLAVAFNKFNINTKIIFDCGDPFYTNTPKKAPYWKLIESKVYSKADFILVPTEKAIPSYTSYISEDNIRVIPQGLNIEQFEIDRYKKHDIPTFAYAGQFYLTIRNPLEFLKYLQTVSIDYKLYIYTNINSKAYLAIKSCFNALGDRIIINDYLPRKECIKKLSTMDFNINFENDSDCQVPSKLIDYGIAGRPILSVSTRNFDPRIFEEFLQGDYTHRMQIDISQYDIRRVADQFEELF